MELFDEAEEEVPVEDLKISKDFARKYHKRKLNEDLVKAERIFKDQDDGSDWSDEDSEAVLINDTIEEKIFDTLIKIKKNDPSIHDPNVQFFSDKDFETTKPEKQKKEKRLTYADHFKKTLLEEGAEAWDAEVEALEQKRLTPMEEAEQLKADFLKAAEGAGEDGLFEKKEKSKEEADREHADDAHYFKDKPVPHDEDSVLMRYWDDGAELNDEEKFLRDYLGKQKWKQSASLQITASDSEDEKHLDEAEEFEHSYNFRFEEEDAGAVKSYARNVVGSVRQKDNKKKEKKKAREVRKADQKNKQIEELKRLKRIKQQEIVNRIKLIAQVTGNETAGADEVDLDGQWDPEQHDREMAKVLGQDYEAQEEILSPEELVEGKDLPEDVRVTEEEQLKSVTSRLGKQVQQADKDGEWEGEENGEWNGEEWNGEEWQGDHGDQDGAGQPEEEVAEDEWFLCDSCDKAILPGKKRFDCTVCEDFVQCQQCFRSPGHPHKMIRKKVPKKAAPPEELVEGKRWSDVAPEFEKEEKEKLKQLPKEEQKKIKKAEAEKKQTLEAYMDEYFSMEFEDIIGGDLPTRFKYTKVTPKNFGLTYEQVLTMPEEELNKIMPKKLLKTYRDQKDLDHFERKHKARQWVVKNTEQAERTLTAERLKAYGVEPSKKSRPEKKRRKVEG